NPDDNRVVVANLVVAVSQGAGLPRASLRVGLRIKVQHHVGLAGVVREPELATIVQPRRKVRSLLAHLQHLRSSVQLSNPLGERPTSSAHSQASRQTLSCTFPAPRLLYLLPVTCYLLLATCLCLARPPP